MTTTRTTLAVYCNSLGVLNFELVLLRVPYEAVLVLVIPLLQRVDLFVAYCLVSFALIEGFRISSKEPPGKPTLAAVS
jgi:hypothetical protein